MRCLGLLLAGKELDEVDERGEPLVGDTLLLMMNAHVEPVAFLLPAHAPELRWERLLDTAESQWGRRVLLRDHTYRLRGRSLALLRLRELRSRP